MAISDQLSTSFGTGMECPNRMPIVVPVVRDGAGVTSTSVLPSSRGVRSKRWPRVSTKRPPPDASTAPGHNAQAVAECAAGRYPHHLGRGEGTFDREEARDRGGISWQARTVVDHIDPVAVVLDVRGRSGIERVVDKLLNHERRQAAQGYASLLAQRAKAAKQRPVFPCKHIVLPSVVICESAYLCVTMIMKRNRLSQITR